MSHFGKERFHYTTSRGLLVKTWMIVGKWLITYVAQNRGLYIPLWENHDSKYSKLSTEDPAVLSQQQAALPSFISFFTAQSFNKFKWDNIHPNTDKLFLVFISCKKRKLRGLRPKQTEDSQGGWPPLWWPSMWWRDGVTYVLWRKVELEMPQHWGTVWR